MLTTGDVAKLFHVSAQTVINWLEQGRLQFERIGNGPRRLTEANVLRYIKEIGITTDALDQSVYQDLLHKAGSDEASSHGPAVLVLTRDGRILTGTDGCGAILGRLPLEVINEPYNRYVQLTEPLSRAPVLLSQGQTQPNLECLWQRPGANDHSGRLTVSPWFETPSVPAGWILAFHSPES